MVSLHLRDEARTHALGAALGAALGPVTDEYFCLFLSGALGSGKTTLTRSLLRALGWPGKVRSPTYTLVEPYRVGNRQVYHLDLYRLSDSQELELLGLRDFLEQRALLLVEWPERGADALPAPDLEIELRYYEESTDARRALCRAGSTQGQEVLATMMARFAEQ